MPTQIWIGRSQTFGMDKSIPEIDSKLYFNSSNCQKTTKNSVLYDKRLLENFSKTLNQTPIAIGLNKIDLINEMTLNTINPLQANIFRNSIFIIYTQHLLDQEQSSESTSNPISLIGAISITIPDFFFNLI